MGGDGFQDMGAKQIACVGRPDLECQFKRREAEILRTDPCVEKKGIDRFEPALRPGFHSHEMLPQLSPALDELCLALFIPAGNNEGCEAESKQTVEVLGRTGGHDPDLWIRLQELLEAIRGVALPVDCQFIIAIQEQQGAS